MVNLVPSVSHLTAPWVGRDVSQTFFRLVPPQEDCVTGPKGVSYSRFS